MSEEIKLTPEEERKTKADRFGFYLMLGILLAGLVITLAWILARTDNIEASSMPSGQSRRAPVTAPVPEPLQPEIGGSENKETGASETVSGQ